MATQARLRFGVMIPPLPNWPVLRVYARLIEELGFDSIWVADHFANPFDTSTVWMEAWMLLAGISACTRQIQIGTLVSTLIYRHPALLAKQAVSLDHLSGGRFVLGLGAGSSDDPAHPMLGVSAWPSGERVSRFEEGVQIIDRMMRQEETSFEGTYYQVRGAVVRPGPLQTPRPALLIGGRGERMLGVAARYADNWNRLGSLKETQAECVAKAAKDAWLLADGARAVGREPDEIRRSFCLGWTCEQLYSSPSAFQNHLYPLIELGVSEFMLGFWKDADVGKPSPVQHVGDEATLEEIAGVAIPSLRSVARAL
jgi:alkanesulfonate monooxygenase SsuD/methylene tetrahydromethanopterin reductase-like flavin-dependent oxidoreductase (luciferase family)